MSGVPLLAGGEEETGGVARRGSGDDVEGLATLGGPHQRYLVSVEGEPDIEQEYVLVDPWTEPRQSEAPNEPPKPRLQALDVFRGFAIVGMILVDNQGNFNDVYEQLNEDLWNGVRFCNLMFPWFLFIMGVAIPIALKRQQAHPDTKGWLKILSRSVKLVAIGVALNWSAHKFGPRFRIMGILQRLGIVYLFAASSFLLFNEWGQRLTAGVFVAIYSGLMYGWHVPDCGKAVLTEDCNAGSYIDRHVFGPDYMIYPNDPEGILTTCTAFLTCFIGVEVGRVIALARRRPGVSAEENERRQHLSTVVHWTVMGTVVTLGGCMLALIKNVPFNKKIWTVSFALLSGGSGALVLAALHLFFYVITYVQRCDLDLYRKQLMMDNADEVAPLRTRPVMFCCGTSQAQPVPLPLRPFVWLGSNPIVIFTLMVFVEIVLIRWAVWNHSHDNAWMWLYDHGLASWISDHKLASLLFSAVFVLVWTVLAWFMNRRGIFIKL